MHIGDGIMAPPIWALGYIIAIPIMAYATKKTGNTLGNTQIPILGVLAAGIFVAQMLNFPIGGGTTGHLVGAALASILLGPYAAVVILTIVLIVQAFLFGDGGVTALGLNLLNMAIISSFTAYAIYVIGKTITPGRAGMYVTIFAAAWASIVISAIMCGIELGASAALSPEYGIPLRIAVPAMAITHVFIGIGEGIVTVLVVTYIATVRPDIILTMKDKWLSKMPMPTTTIEG
jgi:cobalt/nickel transport system permease protein